MKEIIIDKLMLKIKNENILKDISISFEKGKIHGLIGRNGSGKTMLMKCICGFVKATRGQVIVDNKILAQAIMENPQILILDEPMNGLDKEGVEDMRKYLIELRKQGKTIILASHSSEDISVLCDTVNEMDKGQIKKII